MYANVLGSHNVEAAPELYFSDEEANIILSTLYFNDFSKDGSRFECKNC